MVKLELTEREAESLESFITSHNAACEDCSPDIDCSVHKRGFCIAKNMDAVLQKLKTEIAEDG